jgi:DNA-binding NtrC family response regulator
MAQALEILLLDDEPIVGKRLKPALEKSAGCLVETFQDPRQALRRIEEKEFDIVVTDIKMDDIDGIQVLEQVAKKSPRTKVIIITGYAMMSLAREAMDKGAFDFIAKPFKPDDLRAVIERAVQAQGSPADLRATSA